MHIHIILGSVRQGRIGPDIGKRIAQAIHQLAPAHTCEIVDLVDWPLPMDDEPALPASGEYQQPHTRRWSEKIRQGEMMIFLFPQYNWGYPAALKNALDHLYQEWADKPALIISYANRGGGKAAAQLEQVLTGLHMRPLSEAIPLTLSELGYAEGKQPHPDTPLPEPYQQQLARALAEAERLVF